MITIVTTIAFLIVIWRSVVVFKDNDTNDNSLSIVKLYIFPMLLLSTIAVAIGLYIPIPYELSGDIASLRRVYILVAHISYAAVISTIIFLVITNKYRSKGRHVIWSLIFILIALLSITAVFLISGEFNRAAYGTYFFWEASTTSRVLLFCFIFLAGFFCVIRSFRYSKTPNTNIFWLEPGLLSLGIIVRIIGAIIGYYGASLEAYTWL